MTAQQTDILVHNGQELELCSEPLEIYLARNKINWTSKCPVRSTGNWRGYIATWQIKDRKLLLTAISDDPTYKEYEEYRDYDETETDYIDEIFSNGGAPVHATWFSGKLRCVEGEIITYVHAGFASQYERDRIITIRKGMMTREVVIDNAPASD